MSFQSTEDVGTHRDSACTTYRAETARGGSPQSGCGGDPGGDNGDATDLHRRLLRLRGREVGAVRGQQWRPEVEKGVKLELTTNSVRYHHSRET